MPEPFNLQSAREFATKYGDATSEKQLAQSFWRDFFSQIVGVPDLMSVDIEFEYPVRSSQGTVNFVDVLWNGVVLIEHKSAGKDLDLAERQAREYLVALPAIQRPPTIIVSDFKRIRIVEVLLGSSFEFELAELPQHLNRLELVIGGHAEAAAKEEVSADQKAVAALEAAQVGSGFESLVYDDEIGRLSVVGAGMRSNAGVSAQLFTALSDAGINIEMISTSEIRISVIMRAAILETAVKAVHSAFGLDGDSDATVYAGTGR